LTQCASVSRIFIIQGLTSHQRRAPVPAPKIADFNPILSRKKAKNRSSKKQEKYVEEKTEKSIEHWLRYAPTFRLPNIQLSELAGRSKNAENDIDAANTTILQMNSLQPDACSMRLVDGEGKTMVCVFSHRMQSDEKKEGSSEDEVFFSPHLL
jgi:hypothetical protein